MATKSDVLNLLLEIQHLPKSPITQENTEQIVDMYTADLQDIPADVLAAAGVHYRTSPNPFFPSTGQLREKATELLLLAMNIPSASEAWNQVMTAVRFVDSVWCADGASLYSAIDGKQGREYWDALFAYKQHSETCEKCERGGFREVYSHPIVERIVRSMGGRDRILTDNLTADRSQFIKAYAEIAAREVTRATLPDTVRQTVASIASEKIQMLADGMTR